VNVVKEDDDSLVMSTLAGNSDDFRKLWDRYRLDAERWAFQYIRDPFEAEEIAQAAFTEAYSRLSTLQGERRFGGWLRRIVRNIAASRLRKLRKMVPIEEVHGVYSGSRWAQINRRYEVAAPDILLERQEQNNRLEAAINRLSSAYQRVITIFYFDDGSLKDIAAEMDMSVTAAKVTLHRARQQLRKEMLEDE
jgi:RNA polymerase sigma-70 factor (ECF subfamily)